jgi:CheY-like chemotaxis protein
LSYSAAQADQNFGTAGAPVTLWQFAEKQESRRSCRHAIFVTGNDSQANRAPAIASGCVAYLTKPLAAHSLIKAIERACAGGHVAG